MCTWKKLEVQSALCPATCHRTAEQSLTLTVVVVPSAERVNEQIVLLIGNAIRAAMQVCVAPHVG